MAEPAGRIDLFVRVAAEDPERLAVRTLTEDVTFGELEERAGGLAHRVAATSGEGPVLLLAGSGIELAVGTLGVIGAARALIPADPLSGPAQIEALVDELSVSTIVTSDPGRLADIGMRSRVPVIGLGDLDAAPLHPPPLDVHTPVLIGLTSGSSGPPKAHRETQRLLVAPLYEEIPGDPSGDDRMGMLLGATRSAVRRVLHALVRGSTLSCFDARSAPIANILAGFASHAVTYLVLIPTYLRRVCQAAVPGPALSTLRVLWTGGEPLLWQDVAAIRRSLSPDCTVKVGYGATESGRVTRRLVAPDEPLGDGTVPVGWPLPGQSVWIASDNGTPALAGEVGEIVVESTTIREGVDVENLPSGKRRYRTGDLGRFQPDGQLVILGRVDRMIKIGGIRVEPQRIEDVLRELDGVEEVAAVPMVTSHGRAEVVAHLAGRRGRPLRDSTIRAHAEQHMHAAAVPTRFVWHPEGLPTLPSGKVDLPSLAAFESWPATSGA